MLKKIKQARKLFQLLFNRKKRKMKTINAQELKRWINEKKHFQLIDVREEAEFKQGHIEGAKLIPMTRVPFQMEQIDKNKPIVLYCLSGMRSQQVGMFLLQELNYEEIYNLEGGINSWKQ